MIEDKVFERIGYIRKTKHFSMYRLGERSGYPLLQFEQHHSQTYLPTIATLEKLCKGLNITLSDFF